VNAGHSSGNNPDAAPAVWRPAGQKPTTTLLLRHGETALSIDKRFAGSTDLPLTENGLRQVKAAAAALAARGGVELIVTSPLRRARQTAAEVASATGAQVRVEDGIRESDFGKWEGLSFAEASEQWPEAMAAWLADPAVPPPAGESFTDVGARVGVALEALLAAEPGKRCVLVSHVTPIKELVARAVLAPSPIAIYRMQLDVASLCEIDWYPDGAVLRTFNDTGHLRTL
jgi:probable phosphoglycerate mutase